MDKITHKTENQLRDSIYIEKLYFNSNVLCCEIIIGNKPEIIETTFEFFSNRNLGLEYGNIVTDRADAYIWGLIFFAIQHGYDIVSKVPISESLYYNLNTFFIDALTNSNPHFYRTRIECDTITDIHGDRTVVATGISCGIDSLYTIKNAGYGLNHKINTLTFYNAGAAHFSDSTELRTALVEDRINLAKSFAHEYGYDFVFIESNIHLIMQKYYWYNHVDMHTYSMLFCSYHLQKILKHYYYSSGYSLKEFELPQNTEVGGNDTSHYDLLILSQASISGMTFHSSGAHKTRLEKTKDLIHYAPAHKYLNVCVQSLDNCCTCEKCYRTIFTLESLGVLNEFSKVFDLEKFYSRRKFLLREMYYSAKYEKDILLNEIVPFYKDQITLYMKIRAFFAYIRRKVCL